MTVDEIIGCVIGCVALVCLIGMLIFMCLTGEKSEQSKRELMKEVTLYYKHRNEMFEKESEGEK